MSKTELGKQGRPQNQFVELRSETFATTEKGAVIASVKVDVKKRPSSKTKKATRAGLEVGPNKRSIKIHGEKVFANPDATKPEVKNPRAIAEGLGSMGQSHDVFVAAEEIQEGEPIDTETTGNLPTALFANQIGDAITPYVAEKMAASGLFNLDLADSIDGF